MLQLSLNYKMIASDRAINTQNTRIRHEFMGQAWLGTTPRAISAKALGLMAKQKKIAMTALPADGQPNPPPLSPCTGRFTQQK